jgi:hypothetical protein
MKKLIDSRYFIGLSMAALLAACGGGGGGSSTSTTASSASISGQVIDGYIIGAKVCLDVNSNNICDAGEPGAMSEAPDGRYTLPAYAGSIAGLQVIAEVGPTAVDKDTGTIGTGNGYSLMAPAAASATVTPLSTLVSTTIAAGGGESQVSIGEALSSVSASTGIPVAKLVANDYKANGDTKTGATASATAAALSQVNKILSADTTIAAKLTPGQIVSQVAQQVQTKVLPQLISDGQVTAATSTSTKDITTAVTQAVTSANLSGQVQNIVAATQSGAGTVLSMADLFKAGFVTPQFQMGDYINSAGARYDGPSWSPANPSRIYWKGYSGLSVGYLQFDISTATAPPPNIEYVLANNNKWYAPYQDGEEWTFDGPSWVIGSDIGSSASTPTKPVFDQNCIIVAKNAKGTVSQRYCAIEKKLDGQLMTKYIPSMCTNGPAIASTCAAATFPTGSSAYDLTATTIATLDGAYNGLFTLWANIDNTWEGYCTKAWDNVNSKCTSKTGTLIDFINLTKLPNVQWMGDSCNTPFAIQSYSASTKKGVIAWGSNPTLGCSGNYQFNADKIVETSNFEVISLAGKDVMIVPTPAIYRVNNPSSDAPYRIFAVQTSTTGVTGVWGGSYFPTKFKESIPFTGDPATNTQIISTVMFDAILKQKGIAAYPYKGKSSSGKWNGSAVPSIDPN